MKILVNKITDIHEFVRYAGNCNCDIELKSGKYTVDAKSMLGVFSLDLSQPVEVVMGGKDDAFLKNIEKFVVEE